MNPQDQFPVIAWFSALCWCCALVLFLPPLSRRLGRRAGVIAVLCGWLPVAAFMALLWAAIGRPPMRSMGETRLWYVTFLPLIGLAVSLRLKTRAAIVPTVLMALMFLATLLVRKESFDAALMPALDSPWFVPHVVVYMAAYALLGAAAALALSGLVRGRNRKEAPADMAPDEALLADRLARVAFPLLSAGMIMGAVWAKIAWGRCWSWDPKETWAFLTWVVYLFYFHLDWRKPLAPRSRMLWLSLAFLVLLTCWFGVNVLPTAAQSMHTYAN